MTGIAKIGVAAATACAALLASSPAAAKRETGAVQVYRCQLNKRLPEGGYADLQVMKSFREDGAVNSMFVRWEDNQGSLVHARQPDDRIFITLQWPGEQRFGRGDEPFDWSHGSIKIHLLVADAGANFRLLPGEEWRQVVIDRNNMVMVHEQDGMRTLFLSGLDMHLVSELEPPSSMPGGFTMSLDSFLAWSSGAERLTVYETRVTRRKKEPNSYPLSPAGRIRVIGSYEVDPAAVARAYSQVRAATEAWEAGLADTWRRCERTTEGGEIVVTSAGR